MTVARPARLKYPPARLRALRTAFKGLDGGPIFTVWRWALRGEKWQKLPAHPHGTRGITLDEAIASYTASPGVAGLGVKLGPVPGSDVVLFGVDYDGAAKGPLPAPWPKSSTYSERSPSGGDKFHVLGLYKGAALEGKRKDAVEIYSEGRFFTLTGERLNGAAIRPTDPLPYYAAIGVPDPRPYGAPAAVDVTAAPVKESELTARERALLDAVRGIDDADESLRDYKVCADLVVRGATDDEAARILCAGFWREKLARKDYVGRTLARARDDATKAKAFRDESRAIGEGAGEAENPPPIFSVDEAVAALVFVSEGSQVVPLEDARLAWSFSDFQNLTAASVVYEKKKGRPSSVARIWLRHPERQTVHARTFKAGAGVFCRDPEDRRAINTWREPPRATPPADWPSRVKPFLDHVAYLVPVAEERDFLLDWLAHIDQRPGVLPHVHVLMYTHRHGIGRNWLSSVLARAWPGAAALDIDLPALLESRFNGRLSRKILAVVNEIREGGGAAAYRHADTLRTLLTNERRAINPKYGREYEEFNSCRWLMFSNNENALPLDRFDRRIYAIRNPDEPRSADHYAALYAMAGDAEFIAAVREALRTRDISKFNPGMRAPLTEAKLRVIEAGMSDADLEMRDVVAEYPADCITGENLTLKLFGPDASQRDRAALRHIALRHGARPYRKRIAFDLARRTVWVLRNHDRWLSASDAATEKEVRRGIASEVKAHEPKY